MPAKREHRRGYGQIGDGDEESQSGSGKPTARPVEAVASVVAVPAEPAAGQGSLNAGNGSELSQTQALRLLLAAQQQQRTDEGGGEEPSAAVKCGGVCCATLFIYGVLLASATAAMATGMRILDDAGVEGFENQHDGLMNGVVGMAVLGMPIALILLCQGLVRGALSGGDVSRSMPNGLQVVGGSLAATGMFAASAALGSVIRHGETSPGDSALAAATGNGVLAVGSLALIGCCMQCCPGG